MKITIHLDGKARAVPLRQAWNEWFEALTDFCCAAPKCYAGWPRERVRDYLAFHLNQRTLAWCGFQTCVIGCAVAWQDDEASLRARAQKHGHGFAWQRNNPRGDCVFVADVIGRVRGAMRTLITALVSRWPEWRRLKIFTFRKGVLVEYPARIVRRITGKA